VIESGIPDFRDRQLVRGCWRRPETPKPIVDRIAAEGDGDLR